MTDDSIGMMDKAYFVGKQVLIQWLNELLNLRITKIEECATAAVYCGVMDCLFPGTFQYSRVKW
jgi:RP/EB family microtubule-associated protein